MKIALQLYSIKDISEQQGLCAALDKAKELGYDGVEFAGLFGLEPQQVKDELDKRRLECAGFHCGYNEIKENPKSFIEMAKICGAYSLCVPYYASDSVQGWADFAKDINKIGTLFKENNILFGYHNHVHEFEAIEGKLPIDIIIENVEYENVFFEMDTRHVAKAGADPAAYAKKYAHHIPVLHARDTGGEKDCAVGFGIVDFPAVIKESGLPEWIVVENENFGENEQELADSVKYLKDTFGK